MKKFKVEKGVPIPQKGIASELFPWSDLGIGDSFYVPIPKLKNLMSRQSSISSSGKTYCMRNKLDWKFITRKEGQGVRVWRTK